MGKRIYAFLFFPFLLISVFLFVPIVISIILSFCSWPGYGPISFVGFSNFVKIFTIERFQRALINNTLWIVGTVLISMFVGLNLAYILRGKLRGKGIFTGTLWLPYAIAPVALGYMFYFILDPKIGLLNASLGSLGLDFLKSPWLSDWPLNTISLIISSWWNRIAFSTIIYLAGITTIPSNLIDAARMDGSTGFHQLRKVIYPLLRPFTAIVLAWNILYSFQDNFGFIYVMTGGGPYRATEVIGVSMYKEAFMSSNLGLGSALAFLSMILVLTTAIIILRRPSVKR